MIFIGRNFCFLLLFWSFSYVLSQPNTNLTGTHLKRVWTTADGLPVNHGLDIEEDQDGFIWIATIEGLVRFDGFSFFVYNRDNTPALTTNRIQVVYKTKKGLIFSTQDFVHYSYLDGKIEKLNYVQQGSGSVVQYHYDLDLLYEYNHKYFAVHKAGKKIFEQKGNFFQKGILSRNGVYIAAKGGIFYYHSTSNTIQTIYKFENGWDVSYFGIQKNLTAVVLINGKGLKCFDKSGNRIAITNASPMRYGDKNVISDELYLYEGSKLLNVNTCKDISYFPLDPTNNPSFHAPSHFVKNQIDWTSYSYYFGKSLYVNGKVFDTLEKVIIRIIKNKEGNYFALSREEGLIMYYKPNVTTWLTNKGEVSNIYAINQVNDNVFLTESNIGYTYKVVKNSMGRVEVELYSQNDPTKAFRDISGKQWLLSHSQTCELDAQGKRGRCVSPLKTGLLRIIVQAKNGQYWGSNSQRLYKTMDLNGAWEEVRTSTGESVSEIYRISLLQNGEVWVGRRDNGLFRIKHGKAFQILQIDHPCGNQTREIISDGRHNVWIGTESQGVCHIALSEKGDIKRVTQIKRKDGLYVSGVHRIIDDYMGRFWMNSNYGIFWVSKKDLYNFVQGKQSRVSSVSYDERDGLLRREGNGGRQNAGIYTSSGKILFPTQNGIVEIDPKQIPFRRALNPPAYISSVENWGTHYLPSENLQLPSYARDLTFRYAAIELEQPHNTIFRYRLLGYEDQWRLNTQIRFANYTNLKSGTYTFELQAGIAGDFSGPIFRQVVRIAPFWYETWWFYGLVIMGLGLAGNGWMRFRLRNVILRAQKLEHLVAERTQEITAQQALLSSQNVSLQQQTEQIRQQAAKLQEIDKAKSRLFINLAHEFRTPLTVISTPVEALLRRKGNNLPDDQRRLLESTLRNSNRLLALVNQLLEIARLESGMVPIRLVETDLPGFVRDWVEGHFSEMAAEKHIRIRFEAAPFAFRQRIDAEKVGTILSNLCSNAIKFTPPEGLVLVQVQGTENESCQICITDSGAGIPESEVKRVFDWYYRASMHEVDRTGTGIGLSLSRELARAMGGDLVVTSKLGEGARFCLTLPHPLEPSRKGVTTPEVGVSPQEVVSNTANTDLPLVMIVEDHKEIANMIADGLAEKYRILWAENGAIALSLMDEHLPDLVIADVMMPIMDGWRFLQHLRHRPLGASMPVIMLTAHADDEGHRKSLKYGADVYLQKPFTMDVLLLQIRNLLRQRKELAKKLRVEWVAEQQPQTDMVLPAAENVVFVQNYEKILLENLDNPDFDADLLAERMMISRSKLFSKLRQLGLEPPTNRLARMRMEEALRLLEKGANITEVAFAVGYHSLAGFSKAFKVKYGVSPSEFKKNISKRGF